MPKNLELVDCDAKRAKLLIEEVGKVRCWLKGWYDGRRLPGGSAIDLGGPPGEDSLRQLQIILQQSISAAKEN